MSVLQYPVPDWGRLDAKIVLCGEAPGNWEISKHQPFVGPSGGRLDEWWSAVGLRRQDFYITNVCGRQPPGNNIKLIPRAELELYEEELHERLAKLEDPWLIVPTGDTALRALTGRGGITKWRGSLLEYQDRHGRRIKCIPTIHPAATFRSPTLEKRCRVDWARIARELQTRAVTVPQRQYHIRPTHSDVENFVREVEALPHAPGMDTNPESALAIDIETPHELKWTVKTAKNGTKRHVRVKGPRRITCVGFSYDPSWAICIPTTEAHWGCKEDVAWAWDMLKRLCASKVAKVLQNGLFDSFYLADHGIWLPSCNWIWDTMALHHALDANDEHSLAYMASIYTNEPYWKDSGKDSDGDEDDYEPSGLDDFYRYNCTDAAVTRELCHTFITQLESQGRLEFYQRHYVQMFEPLLTMSRWGIRRDAEAAKARLAAINQEVKDIHEKLAVLAGEPLVAKKAFSKVKLEKFLYETLRLPKKYYKAKGKDESSLTTREVALRQLRLKYPERCGEAIDHILGIRRKEKLREFLEEKVVDPDVRLRCQYNFLTETGRLMSKKNPRGTGRNLQNIDREVRDIFVPDHADESWPISI